MKISAYEKTNQSTSMWAYPLCLLVVLLCVHYYVGVLTWPIHGEDAQRHFNTALGTSLLTSLFWLTIRIIHKNVASTLISILVATNQLSHFTLHKNRLSHQFIHHVIVATGIGLCMPIFYMVAENLISRIHEPEVFIIAITSILFWLLFVLFLLQIFTNTFYLRRLVTRTISEPQQELVLLKSVLSMALANSVMALTGLAIAPVFWINKVVPLFDLIVLFMFFISASMYLLWPMVQLSRRIHQVSKIIVADQENEINTLIASKHVVLPPSVVSERIESLETKKEALMLSLKKIRRLLVALCLAPFPISWFLFKCVEFFWWR